MSLLAECKYDSDKMGMQSPISTTVSDVSIFNGKSLVSPLRNFKRKLTKCPLHS